MRRGEGNSPSSSNQISVCCRISMVIIYHLLFLQVLHFALFIALFSLTCMYEFRLVLAIYLLCYVNNVYICM